MMRAFCSFVVLGVALCGLVIHATVIIPAEFREVVGGSVLIAYGRVIDVQTIGASAAQLSPIMPQPGGPRPPRR